MKLVNLNIIQQYIVKCGCKLNSVDTPITFQSQTSLSCSCGETFNCSIKQLGGYRRRGSVLSCGCVDKKWTNETIDNAIINRNIKRLTDCNIREFQPSVSQVSWKCNKCSNEWHSRVDSVINKKSGCPRCAGNVAYTVNSLNEKLQSQGRTDLIVKEIYKGSFRNKIVKQRQGMFTCNVCNNDWVSNIHNVIKFRYGCPLCNDNISSKVEVDGLKFHSKLEYYFWKKYYEEQKSYVLLRQQKYIHNRRLTCDFYIPEKRLWIEVTGGYLLQNEKYCRTLEEKRSIILQKKENFITVSTFVDVNKLIQEL